MTTVEQKALRSFSDSRLQPLTTDEQAIFLAGHRSRQPVIEQLVAALEAAPLPSTNGGHVEFLGRFYDWYESTAKAAIKAGKGE